MKTVKPILDCEPDKIVFEQACGRVGTQALLAVLKEKGLRPELIEWINFK